MKFKLNPLTGEFDYTSESANKQKLNPLTWEFNLVEGDGPFSQIFNPLNWKFNLGTRGGGGIIAEVTGNWYINLTNAVAHRLMELKAYGWTEQRSSLPSEYTQLEYAIIPSWWYLTTDFIPTYDCKVEFEFTTTTLWTSWATTYLWVRPDTTWNGWLRCARISSQVFRIYGFGSYQDSTDTVAANTRYKFTWDNKRWIVTTGSTTVFDKTYSNTWSNTYPLTINGWNSAGTVTPWAEGVYVHSFKAWDNQWVLAANYIPCVYNNEVGFYDTVSESFKWATAWTFTAWPNAVPTPTVPMDIVSNNWVLKVRHQSWLPIWYTLLDYIQSWWSNYINTWIKLTNEDIVEIQYLQTADKWAVYWEYNSSTSNMSTTLYWNISFYVYGYNAWWNATVVWDYDTNVHTVVHNFIDWYIDFDWVRTNFTLPNPNSFTNALNCPIFWRSNSSSIWYFSKTKLYYFRIRRNWTLILDLIPAKDSNNNVWMYDRVSWTLFTESWSWSFIAWNTVSDPITVYTDWTTETIWVHGKNLFDENDVILGYFYNDSGTYTSNNVTYTSGKIPMNAGTTVTFSRGLAVAGVYLRIHAFDSNDNWIGLVAKSSTATDLSCTGTTPANTSYIRVCGAKKAAPSTEIDHECQVELGSTATEYAPYYNGDTATAEMLLKVSNYVDEQEILSWNIIRKVGVQVFDGTENWKSAVTGKFYIDNYYMRNYNLMPTLCTHYEAVLASSTSQIGFGKIGLFATATQGQSSARLVIGDNNYTSVDDFKAYLSQQYQAGTPIIVLYPLIEQTTETVSGQPLDIPAWNSTIEITQASIDNLWLYAKYLQSN